MTNLLIILGVLFFALAVLMPLLERISKPVTPEDMQKYQKILGILMIVMVIALTIRMLFLDS
jgi:hypothetical protein